MTGWRCVVESCQSDHLARGLCSAHYKELRRTGVDPSGGRARLRGALSGRVLTLQSGRVIEFSVGQIDSFRRRAIVSKSGCWEWSGWVDKHGYGTFGGTSRGQKFTILAHRVSYAIHAGDIPTGLQLDHLCKNTVCVNPAHLEAVTALENLMRSDSLTMRQASATHCKRGHMFNEMNTYEDPRGSRVCRACRRINQAERKARKEMKNAA